MIGDRVQRARAAFEDLSDREKKLVYLMALVAMAFVFLLPLYFLVAKAYTNYDKIETAQTLISNMQADQEKYQKLRAERQRKKQLYDNPAPALGSFLEQQSQRFGITLRDANDLPNNSKSGYLQRSIRVTLNNAPIKSIIEFFASIKDSGHPVSIEKIQLESSGDAGNFDARLTIAAYEKEGLGASAGNASATTNPNAADYEGRTP